MFNLSRVSKIESRFNMSHVSGLRIVALSRSHIAAMISVWLLNFRSHVTFLILDSSLLFRKNSIKCPSLAPLFAQGIHNCCCIGCVGCCFWFLVLSTESPLSTSLLASAGILISISHVGSALIQVLLLTWYGWMQAFALDWVITITMVLSLIRPIHPWESTLGSRSVFKSLQWPFRRLYELRSSEHILSSLNIICPCWSIPSKFTRLRGTLTNLNPLSDVALRRSAHSSALYFLLAGNSSCSIWIHAIVKIL